MDGSGAVLVLGRGSVCLVRVGIAGLEPRRVKSVTTLNSRDSLVQFPKLGTNNTHQARAAVGIRATY